jgi:hypothetical protein
MVGRRYTCLMVEYTSDFVVVNLTAFFCTGFVTAND